MNFLSSNQLVRARAVGISDPTYESAGKESVDIIAAIGQQVVSSDQFFDQVWEGMLAGCKPVDGFADGEKTCMRK